MIRPNADRVQYSFNADVRVDDADALYAEFQQSGAKVLYPPHDQPHDCREFEIEDLQRLRDLLRPGPVENGAADGATP